MESEFFKSFWEMGATFGLMFLMLMYLKKEYTNINEKHEQFVNEVLQKNEAREQEYRNTINSLSETLKIVNEIKSDVQEMKHKIV